MAENQNPCVALGPALSFAEATTPPTPSRRPDATNPLLAAPLHLPARPPFALPNAGSKRVVIKTQVGETVGLYEENHALVIGVSDYTAGGPDLESVIRAVDAVPPAVFLVLNPGADVPNGGTGRRTCAHVRGAGMPPRATEFFPVASGDGGFCVLARRD